MCLFVLVCVSLCWYVLVCVGMCCLRCVVGCVDGSKKICISKKISREKIYIKLRSLQIYINSKNKICTTHFCNYFRRDGNVGLSTAY